VRTKSIDHEFNVDGVKKLVGVDPLGLIPITFLKQIIIVKKIQMGVMNIVSTTYWNVLRRT